MITHERALAAIGTVPDPEVPAISVVELGIVRDVAVSDAGASGVEVRTVLSPAWTTDWIGPEAREKLRAYGIAPPGRAEADGSITLTRARRAVACPCCGSKETEWRSEFGSTACKAIHVCRSCAQPFDEFNAI